MNGNSQSKSNKELTKNSETQEVHNPVHILEKYHELADLITRWPGLPEHIQAAVMALIQTAK